MNTHVRIPRRHARPRRPVLADLAGFADFDRLFDELWRGFGTPMVRERRDAPAFVSPRMDVVESDASYELRAEMPGLGEKDIDVSIEDGVLTLEGTRREESEKETDGVRHVETWRGSFHRAVKLPGGVDEDAVTAAYKNGVLSVKLPKLPEAKPEARAIPISTS